MQELTQLPPDSADEVAALDSVPPPTEPDEVDLELEELLIREITIDGMCGVY
jgi:mycofactocin precursor